MESDYRNNVDGITYSEPMQELKKQINILKQDIERSERNRLDICDSESIILLGKYTCKKCRKGYGKPGTIINHILACHPEVAQKYKPAPIVNDVASTVINDRDDES